MILRLWTIPIHLPPIGLCRVTERRLRMRGALLGGRDGYPEDCDKSMPELVREQQVLLRSP